MPQSTTPPRGCTNFKLRQLLRRVARLYDQEMAEIGLKTTQYSFQAKGRWQLRGSQLGPGHQRNFHADRPIA